MKLCYEVHLFQQSSIRDIALSVVAVSGRKLLFFYHLIVVPRGLRFSDGEQSLHFYALPFSPQPGI